MAMFDEWDLFPDPIKQNLTFVQYLNQKREADRQQRDRRPRAPNRDLKHAMNKLTLATFDGSSQTAARVWIHKLDTYLTLEPMAKVEAIRFSTMHLEGAAYDWQHRGLVTQDHGLITSYEICSSKLITRFDRKDIEVYYRDLAQLRQSGSLDNFIDEFQRISVMVPDMIEQHKVMLFTEGLQDKYRGLVKVLKPNTLDDAIKIAHDLDSPSSLLQPPKKPYRGSTSPQGNNNQQKPNPPRLDFETRNELKRKKLCFTCREPWTPNHKCLRKGKIHYVEVLFEDEGEQQEGNDVEDSEEEVEEQPPKDKKKKATSKKPPIIATLSSIPTCHPFRVKGVVRGQHIDCLLDTGASHNFISTWMVSKKRLQTVDIPEFEVKVAGGEALSCTKKVSSLQIQFDDYLLETDFYVVDLDGLDAILGRQWLRTLHRYTFDHETMQLEFSQGDRLVVLKAIPDSGPRLITPQKMEAILRHDDIEWATLCFISSKETQDIRKQYHSDIQTVLDKHRSIFEDLPPNIPLDRGFEHIIELEEGAKPVINTPYRHPRYYKEEIKKTIKEFLDMGHIRPSSSPFASSVMLIKKKDGTLRMCIDYCALNKRTINQK